MMVRKEYWEMEKEEIYEEKDTRLQLMGQIQHAKGSIRDFVRTREVGEQFLSGALAGAMTKAVLAPLETIRTRMVVGVVSRSIAGSFIDIVEQHGWPGNTIHMLRIVPTPALELGTFQCVKRTMTSVQEKWTQQDLLILQIGVIRLKLSLSLISLVAVGGGAAGVVSTLVCHPLEVLKDYLMDMLPYSFTAITIVFPIEVARKRVMVGSLQGKSPSNISAALSEVIKEEGLKGLYRGWTAS